MPKRKRKTVVGEPSKNAKGKKVKVNKLKEKTAKQEVKVQDPTFSFVAALPRDRPIVLLDVDGAINLMYERKACSGSQDTATAQVKIKCEQFGELVTQSITYKPAIVDRLNKLSNIATIIWLTSWQDNAKTALAPALGLNEFLVSPFKKAEALLHMPPDVPVVWIDDELFDYNSWPTFTVGRGIFSMDRTLLEFANTSRTAPSLFMGMFDLLDADMDLIETFVKDPKSYKGPRFVGLPAEMATHLFTTVTTSNKVDSKELTEDVLARFTSLPHGTRTAQFHYKDKDTSCGVRRSIARWINVYEQLMTSRVAPALHAYLEADLQMIKDSEKWKEMHRSVDK